MEFFVSARLLVGYFCYAFFLLQSIQHGQHSPNRPCFGETRAAQERRDCILYPKAYLLSLLGKQLKLVIKYKNADSVSPLNGKGCRENRSLGSFCRKAVH